MNIHLICIQTYHAHWAGHSGYHHFLSRLPEDILVTHLRIPREQVSGKELRGAEKLWFRLVTHWAKRRVNPWTTQNDLLAEFRLLKRVRKSLKGSEKVIVHFLDGEIGYNFFSSLSQTLGSDKERVRIIVSYHQPCSILEKVLPHKVRTKELDMVLTVGTSQFPFFNFLPEERLRFVPHGIDTDYFRPANRPTDDTQVYCLTVGHWLRDFDTLEQVIRSAPKQVIFRIVAGKEHIKQFTSLKNVELYSGIADEELLRLYQNSDIGLMPLQDSTANNGLLEMMACGLPVISSRVGSVGDYLPEKSGILIDGNDPEAFLLAVKRLADSLAERRSFGEAARNRALELDWTNIAGQMAEIYHGV
jgi:glycosyltransferase involved in cell wall biosynthesis